MPVDLQQDRETPRIDVKKDISITETIKKKTASFSESMNNANNHNKRLSTRLFNNLNANLNNSDALKENKSQDLKKQEML